MRGVLNRCFLGRKLPLTVVDLWFATLADNDFSLQQVLSPDETRRALRFRFDRDAAMFVARRGILRLILARYTGLRPSQLSFTYNHFGKPALNGCFYHVRFSLSQSGNLAVYAVARHRDIGVDLEQFRQGSLEVSRIADSFFAQEQKAALNKAPAERKEEVFLRLWTELEAQGKACGIGIGALNSAVEIFHGQCFSLTRLAPSPGYVLSLAVQGRRRCSLRAITFQVPPVQGWTQVE
jgi:4'-phosphopantetheinyl transferase